MVLIGCFECFTWCDHRCYFTHAPVSACHTRQCRNFTGTRRWDRLYYTRDWRYWISFSHDDVTEYNMPLHLCTDDMHLEMMNEEPDGTLAVKMTRPGMVTSIIYLPPERRRPRWQPGPQDVPPGWTFEHWHFDLAD